MGRTYRNLIISFNIGCLVKQKAFSMWRGRSRSERRKRWGYAWRRFIGSLTLPSCRWAASVFSLRSVRPFCTISIWTLSTATPVLYPPSRWPVAVSGHHRCHNTSWHRRLPSKRMRAWYRSRWDGGPNTSFLLYVGGRLGPPSMSGLCCQQGQMRIFTCQLYWWQMQTVCPSPQMCSTWIWTNISLDAID